MSKIKFIQEGVFNKKSGLMYNIDDTDDLGALRNDKAVKKGYAVYVESEKVEAKPTTAKKEVKADKVIKTEPIKVKESLGNVTTKPKK